MSTYGDQRRTFTRATIAAARLTCPGTGEHGTLDAYRYAGCRCPDAREEARLQRRTYIPRTTASLVPAAGPIRQSQALSAIGWSLEDQSRELSLSISAMNKVISRNTSGYLQARTAERMDTLFQRRRTTHGQSTRARALARSRNYAPPLAWRRLDITNPKTKPWHFGYDLEQVTVQRMIDAARGRAVGYLPDLTLDEKAAVVLQIMDRFTLPAAALTRVFEMETQFAQYLVGKGGVTTKQLTRAGTADYFQPRTRAIDVPLDYIEHGREAMVA